jgi:hypothetical protein
MEYHFRLSKSELELLTELIAEKLQEAYEHEESQEIFVTWLSLHLRATYLLSRGGS